MPLVVYVALIYLSSEAHRHLWELFMDKFIYLWNRLRANTWKFTIEKKNIFWRKTLPAFPPKYHELS